LWHYQGFTSGATPEAPQHRHQRQPSGVSEAGLPGARSETPRAAASGVVFVAPMPATLGVASSSTLPVDSGRPRVAPQPTDFVALLQHRSRGQSRSQQRHAEGPQPGSLVDVSNSTATSGAWSSGCLTQAAGQTAAQLRTRGTAAVDGSGACVAGLISSLTGTEMSPVQSTSSP
jgi:hypothetical protein